MPSSRFGKGQGRASSLAARPCRADARSRIAAGMSKPEPRPLCGITCCLKDLDAVSSHVVNDRYVEAATVASRALPVLLPAIGGALGGRELLDRLDGLLVTGSRSNVDPGHYGGPPPRSGNLADPARDTTTLPLIREALASGVPLLAICRGIQELNVALGGSLHQHLEEVPGRRDHRSDKTKPPHERYGLAHGVIITGARLGAILGGAETAEVNSLHGQGIDRLAARLTVEAVAEDGTIEAVSVEGASAFALGLQWHPEYRAAESPVSSRLFAAFGEAMRARMTARERHGQLSRVA